MLFVMAFVLIVVAIILFAAGLYCLFVDQEILDPTMMYGGFYFWLPPWDYCI